MAALFWLAFFFGLFVYVPIALWRQRQVRIARARRHAKPAERMTLAEADRLVDEWKAETGYKYDK